MIIDPYRFGVATNAVKLLLHTTGTHLSSTDPIIDSSYSAHPNLTRSGSSAVFDTTDKKFVCSLSFTGYGPVYTDTHADFGFGTADFTLEKQCQPSNSYSFADKHVLDTTKNGTVGGYRMTMQYDGSGDPKPSVWSSGAAAYIISSGSYLTRSVFYHLMICKVGGTVYFFVNGSLIGSAADSTDCGATGAISVGGLYNSTSAGCRSEEVRVLKGVGLYTSGFTSPSSPYGPAYP